MLPAPAAQLLAGSRRGTARFSHRFRNTRTCASGAAEGREKCGLAPAPIRDFLALAGDAADA